MNPPLDTIDIHNPTFTLDKVAENIMLLTHWSVPILLPSIRAQYPIQAFSFYIIDTQFISRRIAIETTEREEIPAVQSLGCGYRFHGFPANLHPVRIQKNDATHLGFVPIVETAYVLDDCVGVTFPHSRSIARILVQHFLEGACLRRILLD